MPAALIVSHDVIGREMAGPGIRYWELSGALDRRGLEVTLAVPEGSTAIEAPFPTLIYRPEHHPGASPLTDAANGADAVVVTGPILDQFPLVAASDTPLVVDLYDPFLLENLHRFPGDWPHHAGGLATLRRQLERGDFFLCATERQRDLYVGMLTALGRVNPATYATASLNDLLDVVAFGIPGVPPSPGPALRGALPGIGQNDRLILWNGGLWSWFDPETAIRAVARMARVDSTIRLVFLGTRHPNSTIGEPPTAQSARALADRLGLTDRHVFFREWTPYAERGACLLEADVALSLHLDGIETRYAARTRLVDCIWAGLPVVTTVGDEIGDDLARRGLAISVPPGDDAAVAIALRAMLDETGARTARQPAFTALAAERSWDNVVAPLARFLERPRRAPDAAVHPAEASADARGGTGDVSPFRRLIAALGNHRR